MSMELLRLGLQFFAGETKEEEDEVIIPGEEGVTGASGVTGSTPPAYTVPENAVSAPVAQDFDTWYKANGGMDEAGYYAKYDLDPERDYLNTVNTLNYEYQTSMATYGEQAEKMYQMGLQNSGVSDIFQANAFSAYLGNMNQAAADRITARKKNKAAFNDYVADMKAQHGQYETGIKTEYDTKLNSALTYALSKYNGYNLNQILSELGVSGYYTEIVQDVANRLSGMDSTTLKAETESALAQSIINSISGFTGSDADKAAAKSMLGGMFPDDVIEAAFGRAQAIYNNSPEAADATVQSWVDTLYGSFTGNEVDFDDWNNYQLADVPENLRVKIKEAIRQQFDGKVGEIYSDLVERYTPESEESLKEHYKNLGYNDYEISEAIRMIKNVYKNDPGAQAATTEKNVAAIISSFGENAADFDPSNYGNDKQTFINEMIKDGTYNEEEAGQAWEQMKVQWDSDVGTAESFIFKNYAQGEEWINAQLSGQFSQSVIDEAWDNFLLSNEGKQWQGTLTQASVDDLVSTWTESFDPNMSKEEFVTKMITGEDEKVNEDLRANAEAAWDVMKGAYDEHIGKLDTFAAGLWLELGEVYTGSNDEKSTIDNYLQSKGIIDPKDIEYIRGKIEEKKTQKVEDIKEDTLTGITETPNDEVSYSGLLQAIKDNGDDPDVITAASVKYKDAVMNALDSPENLANAYKLVPGIDKTTWDGLDDAGKLDALLNGIGEAHKAKTMMDKEYYSVIESWVDNEIRDSDDVSGVVSIVNKLKQYKNAGYLSEDYYNAFYGKMAAAISPDEFKIYSRATSAGPEYWFSFKSGDDNIRIKLVQSKKKSSEFKNGIDIDGGRMYIDGGTLYLQYGNVIYSYGGLSKTEIDKKKTDSTVSKEIFSLISTAVSNTFITVSGSSENGGTKGKGDTQGGRTGDFAVANK